MNLRPRVLAALPGLFPSTVINVAKPLLRLHEARAIELELSLHFLVRRRQIERADVLVMSHTIDPAHAWILDCARESGTPLLYDIDENLLEPPPDVRGLDFLRAPARQAVVRRALSQAALVRTYAAPLERYLLAFNTKVVRTDGPVEWWLVPSKPRHRHDRVHIVYATSRLNDAIGQALIAPLRLILDEHPKVDVTIWGPRFAELEKHPRVRFREFIRDYDRYFKEFARAGFDIGLAPMPAELFYQCKTATKFREYAACGIAGIYADTDTYRDCVTDGETGLLVRTPSPTSENLANLAHPEDLANAENLANRANSNSWFAAIDRLICDTTLREQIRTRAQAYARQRYAAARIEGDWLAHLEKARCPRRPAADATVAAFAREVNAARQSAGYARKAVNLVRVGGVGALWNRLRAQLAGVRQLIAWELTLRRRARQQNRS